ncbi:PREDICTED: uncharacterized protein LOC108369543 isoform X1 [Rhagoletis zephyria]|uniref:uncharacterized protein LOC108369543 isoform X1 n=1 Tax=Rhagoletis zephyria TaxID=28612 RepID=UPI00081140C1|nr:PREDICTED: uncharacterized protein LOC108369543 isoform X1 [Rhagoletis zephyria]
MYMSANNKQTFSVSINGLNIEKVHHFKWLGRTISANSTIKVHIREIKRATTSGKNLISKLTSIKSGISPKTSINLFKAFVRSKAEYANTSYANAPKGYNKQLQTSVNETLRRCLGVPPNTPTLMRYALACELPPLPRAVWLTAKELVKQWLINPELRTQIQNRPPINSSYSITYEKFKAIINTIDTNVAFKRHHNLNCYESELAQSKKNVTPTQLRAIYNKKINTLKEEGFKVYATDASVSDNKIGCAVYVVTANVSYLYNIDGNFTSTYGELVALSQEITIAINNESKKVAIFTDSQSAIKALKSRTTQNFLVAEIHNKLYHSQIENIAIIWTPSHVGITINEKADIAAKTAVDHGKSLPPKLTPCEALRRISKMLGTEAKTEFTNKLPNWDPDIVEFCTPKEKQPWFKNKILDLDAYDIKLFNRIATGHTYGSTYLTKFQHYRSDNCSACNIKETPEHLIFDCIKYNNLRNDNSLFRKKSLGVLSYVVLCRP